MATPKSKKRKRARQPQRPPSRLERLRQKLVQGPFGDSKFVVNPSGAEKMSEVLGDFVEPYMGAATTKEAYQKLITLGITAWNAALLPEAERSRMLDEVLMKGLGDVPASLKKELREFVGELIARKDAHFADNRRAIVDFTVEESHGSYHLSVVSTLQPSPLA